MFLVLSLCCIVIIFFPPTCAPLSSTVSIVSPKLTISEAYNHLPMCEVLSCLITVKFNIK
jgi:hypothetical protein